VDARELPDTKPSAGDRAYQRPPAEGERAALVGYGAQYEVAAGLLLRALTDEVSLDWLAVMDPTAGRLDDFQLATEGQLDAYQTKWSESGGQLPWGELTEYLEDLLRDRRKLAGDHPGRRVIGHLTTDRVPSSSSIHGAPDEDGPHRAAAAVAELLLPASQGRFDSVEALPPRWRWLWDRLAKTVDTKPQTMLEDFAYVRLEFGQRLPKQDLPSCSSRDAEQLRRDIDELHMALLDVARDPSKLVRLTRDQFINRLPGAWRKRLELAAVHDFPAPLAYEPIQSTASALTDAIARHHSGYVALIGSPGSGKSTLLSQELQGRPDVVARYYAYVRGRGEVGSERAEAANFLHDLVLTLERYGLPRGPGPVDFDLGNLTHRLRERLAQLGRFYRENGRRAVILIDGLDHVERADPTVSLLKYLPVPSEMPEGVLFVVGSQTVRMLHEEIRTRLRGDGRTVHMERLEVVAIERLRSKAGVSVDTRDLQEVTEGHPLLLDYVLYELASLPPEAQAGALSSMPPYGGDVRALYDRLWSGSIRDNAELVELLALVSRIRAAIDLEWLRDQGQPGPVVRTLQERLTHLFRRDGLRWHFFHDSFRVYLQTRTATIGEDTNANEQEARHYHRQLAEMCEATDPRDVMHWEVLFHRASADDHQQVLALATPAFFRQQLFALRPPSLVAGDIAMAARSLAVVQDPMALVRLALAAGELSQRGYHDPDRKKFLELLLATGRWRTVVEHLESERDEHGSDDPRTLPLQMAGALWHADHREEARRVFLANEPLDVLQGRVERHARHPEDLLYAWARAAVLLRSAEAVLAAADALDLNKLVRFHSNDRDITPQVRAWMLAEAAEEADDAGEPDGAQILRKALDREDPVQRVAWVQCHLNQLADESRSRAPILEEVLRFEPDQIAARQRVWLAELLLELGRDDDARRWVDGLEQPPASESVVTDVWESESYRYQLHSVLARLGRRLAGAEMIANPTADHHWASVHLARVVIDMAQLHGAASAGEGLEREPFMRAVQRLLRVFEWPGRNRMDSYTLRSSRSGALATLVWVAAAHGEPQVRAYWQLMGERWAEQPIRLLSEGNRVIPRIAQTGAVEPGEVRAAMQCLVNATRAHSEAHELATNLVEAAHTALALEDRELADNLLMEAVHQTLAIYPDKDYQLTAWIELLRPRLDCEDGTQMVDWLAGTLVDIREEAGGAAAGHAGERLVADEAKSRPASAWKLSGWLEEHGVLDRGDRMSCLLRGTQDETPDSLWWTVLGEGLLPIAAQVPRFSLDKGTALAVRVRGATWAGARLRSLAVRVEVEVPSGLREGWREKLADAAAANGIDLGQLGLPRSLHPDRRPPRSRSRGTNEDKRDAYLAEHDSPEKVLQALRDGDSDSLDTPWSEAFERVAPRLTLEQFKKFLELRDAMDMGDRVVVVETARRLGELALARALIDEGLKKADSSRWRRNYDGGTLLKLMMALRELDPEEARRRAYIRFAADASTDRFLLSGMAEDLKFYRDLFGIDDEEAVADEIETYVRLLLKNPQQLPPRDETDERTPLGVLAQCLLDLLASPYRLAVITAQHAILAALDDNHPDVWSLLRLQLEHENQEIALRVFSVLEAYVMRDSPLTAEVLTAVERWAASDNLALREAGLRLLAAHGRTAAPVPRKDLPPALQMEIAREPLGEWPDQPALVGGDSLDRMVLAKEGEFEGLARMTKVNPEALEEHVARLARQMAGDQPVDDDALRSDHGVLGWTYHLPSLTLLDHAALQAAAQLVDSRGVDAAVALLSTTGPLYDPRLIRQRPVAQPPEVPLALKGHSERWVSEENWLKALAGAAERLVRHVGEWVVIGELTDVRHLDREMPRERRWQCLTAAAANEPKARPHRIRRTLLSDLQVGRIPGSDRALIAHLDFDFRGASEWLALSPFLADSCGWQPTDQALIGYRDPEGVVVRSVWWRSGWLASARWTAHDQVGDGWLVLVAPRGLEVLENACGEQLNISWEVKRDFLSAGKAEDSLVGSRDLRARGE
jgi:hypothetical protein